MTLLHTEDSLKAVREALCVAQAAIENPSTRTDGWGHQARVIHRLIDDIDRQRPVGPNGKHGSLHTPHCQCRDQ